MLGLSALRSVASTGETHLKPQALDCVLRHAETARDGTNRLATPRVDLHSPRASDRHLQVHSAEMDRQCSRFRETDHSREDTVLARLVRHVDATPPKLLDQAQCLEVADMISDIGELGGRGFEVIHPKGVGGKSGRPSPPQMRG